MPTLTRKFDSGKWTFDYDVLPKGGLVLGNVKHDNFFLAKDIRVVSIWINPGEPNSKQLYLGTDDFTITANSPSGYRRYSSFNAPPPFDIYTKKGMPKEAGLQIFYQSKNKIYDDNDPLDGFLLIEQNYIFAEYGKDPPHEPGGVLQATRFFPLIKFSYTGTRIKTIRIDYRFEISLDLFYDLEKNKIDPKLDNAILFKDLIPLLKGLRPNLSGIFRDNETTPIGTSPDVVFAAVEKPALNEVQAFGLKHGIPGEKLSKIVLPDIADEINFDKKEPTIYIKEEDRTTWDNLHVWANYKRIGKYIKKQPSTPGAFHAFHVHWRWGNAASDPSDTELLEIKLGTKIKTDTYSKGAVGMSQFRGLKIADRTGGPLLDHNIPDQTIRFAITKVLHPEVENNSTGAFIVNKWDADKNASTEKYEDLFFDENKKPDPRDLSRGENLIFWFSTEITNHHLAALPKTFQGTTFIHGCYFAHSPELDTGKAGNPFAETIGTEIQKPKYLKPTWQRHPNGQ